MTRSHVAIGVAVMAAMGISVGCGNGGGQPATESEQMRCGPRWSNEDEPGSRCHHEVSAADSQLVVAGQPDDS